MTKLDRLVTAAAAKGVTLEKTRRFTGEPAGYVFRRGDRTISFHATLAKVERRLGSLADYRVAERTARLAKVDRPHVAARKMTSDDAVEHNRETDSAVTLRHDLDRAAAAAGQEIVQLKDLSYVSRLTAAGVVDLFGAAGRVMLSFATVTEGLAKFAAIAAKAEVDAS